MRSLSHSEISMAMTCEARHAFAYTGHLTEGETLDRKAIAPILSSGRAFGAAVAAWHAFPAEENLFSDSHAFLAKIAAQDALRTAYAEDVKKQLDAGIRVDLELQVGKELWLAAIVDHYTSTAEKLPNLTRLEGEISVPIPSRGGKRASTRYRFNGFLDGYTIDSADHDWLVEYKLRTSLTPAKLVELSRQVRWYAWSHRHETGANVVGAIVEERLADPPKPPRLVQAKRKSEGIDGLVPSHAKDQLCVAEDYIALCKEYDVDPEPDTVAALEGRKWQQRIPITFTEKELEEAGQELVSAAKLIRDLDSGERYPVRNTQPQLCRSCRFLEACPNPGDRVYLDTLYERKPPKRLRVLESVPTKFDYSVAEAEHVNECYEGPVVMAA